MKAHVSTPCDTPSSFIAAHPGDVIGELHGLDRLRLQGSLCPLYRPEIMDTYLHKAGVLYKDYKAHVEGITGRMRKDLEWAAFQRQRQVLWLPSSRESKEERARQIAAEEGISSGVICVFSCLETARAMEACPNRATRKLEFQLREKRARHFYVYLFHTLLGFLHVRFQLWFPFLVQICLNGREWLSRQMTAAGLGFTRERNTFTQVEDVARAQQLFTEQLNTDWPALGNELVAQLNPVAAEVRAVLGLKYYWTAPETEYATDLMFRDRRTLEKLYPKLVHHGITSFGCTQVLRFLGQSPHGYKGDAKSTCRRRPEGVCLKHWSKGNSIKMYDKGSVLRVETTINQPEDFHILRRLTPEAELKRYPLRRSTADLHERARLSRSATLRYLEAFSGLEDKQTLGALLERICRRVKWKGQWHRALNPCAAPDSRLLAAINDAKYTIAGLTNADLRSALGEPERTAEERRRSVGRITRRIRLLRAHHLIRKVANSHRYHVTPQGRRLITALLAAQRADIDQLTRLAA